RYRRLRPGPDDPRRASEPPPRAPTRPAERPGGGDYRGVRLRQLPHSALRTHRARAAARSRTGIAALRRARCRAAAAVVSRAPALGPSRGPGARRLTASVLLVSKRVREGVGADTTVAPPPVRRGGQCRLAAFGQE